MSEYKICQRGLWDSTIPGIEFDENGVSNYAKMFDKYVEQYPRGQKGKDDWDKYLSEIKLAGKNKKYDCIIGVSGGTDSSYLMHLAIKQGLRPLAVTLDNGWSSDVSVQNIKNVTNALKIDLETYVIDYEEIKDIQKSYIKAGLPWIDFPTDQAIKSVLYRIANRENIKYILIGHDFRSEGSQPNEWTYGDSKQIKYIQKKFGTKKLKTFPNISIFENAYLGYVKGIKMIYPFFYLDYKKSEAQKLLIEKYNWKYYGGHHHENAFTKFAIAYWMPQKFGMDKRIITFSAQILSGDLTREKALKLIKESPYDLKQMENDKLFTIKKLDMTPEEFSIYWNSENKSFHDYPSYSNLIEKLYWVTKPLIKLFVHHLPAHFIQLEVRKKKINS
ncbi:MAG: N-acetyl sugar amidotransferase [Ignavibacteriaceae bacterium]|jgi:N-acetyl sugar amidotransferase|nr:MAG: N-acetyl sugar amidotransferase [Chlorobiota bacterium]KXK06021.1 MAG: N-acetyl sugar amidotransferase [Chlorobi bacterium OLB4]MBV6398457.1 hypothetical protein [Ignavibacteria bacterium]MCC6885691.1 N-acetyl sugar amidotransferase [Ignavibacteriales bacterium]MCE7953114.1 N-acetyl sugar amidotransferase [Chlorobi bacterium CHB7]MDL1887048.1 N-acetyl sugar amidotransferase [Ignavibacteria bacterium CHB1]MEB2329103.1 N-acetyl sugar amidotransferase [Ignavibacteriaceae bacterium]OQY77